MKEVQLPGGEAGVQSPWAQIQGSVLLISGTSVLFAAVSPSPRHTVGAQYILMNKSNERGQHALGLSLPSCVTGLTIRPPQPTASLGTPLSTLGLRSSPSFSTGGGGAGRGRSKKTSSSPRWTPPTVTSQAARESRPASLPWDRAWKGTRQS